MKKVIKIAICTVALLTVSSFNTSSGNRQHYKSINTELKHEFNQLIKEINNIKK